MAPAGLPKFSGEGARDRPQMRVLGLYRAAEAEIPLPVAGNEPGARGLCGGSKRLPGDRTAERCRPSSCFWALPPKPWRPADSLVWGKLMALQLGGNYRGELLRARMARTISAADLAVLYPEYPKDAPTTLAEMIPIYRRLALDRLYAELPAVVGPHYASNNWVVDGAHSASGKPLLANDPHLAFSAPGFWYLARLKTPQHDIAGGTAAGVPLVVIGHNERIAWGFTTTTADVEDLFVEKIDPADPGRYLTPQGSLPFESRHETIGVKGAAPVEITIRETRHGPVLSDASASRRGRSGLCSGLGRDIHDAGRPQRRGDMGHQPGSRLAELSRGPARNSSGRCRTSSTPMSMARSASSRRGGCRSARKRRWLAAGARVGPGNTIGPGSSRSLHCRAL